MKQSHYILGMKKLEDIFYVSGFSFDDENRKINIQAKDSFTHALQFDDLDKCKKIQQILKDEFDLLIFEVGLKQVAE